MPSDRIEQKNGYSAKEALALLTKERKNLSDNPASILIGQNLSPKRTYLEAAAVKKPSFQDTETYYRSEKHPITKKITTNSGLAVYEEKTLKNGNAAHVGNYKNFMQLLGDVAKPTPTALPSYEADAVLYNNMLEYRNKLCKYILTRLPKLTLLTVGHYNDYPCLMVHISKKTIIKTKDTKAPSNSVFEEWVNLLLSFYVGMLNHYAYQENIPIEMVRRSGFGALGPSVATTGESFRINIGLVPKQYVLLIVKALQDLETLLTTLKNDTENLPPLPAGIFYNSKEHKEHLGKKYPPVKLKNMIELLWAQVEKRGKRTVQNINRTAFARDGFSAEVFKALEKKQPHTHAFFNALKWVTAKLNVTTKGKRSTLSFSQSGIVKFKPFKADSQPMIADEFWQLISDMLERIKTNVTGLNSTVIDTIQLCYNNKSLNRLYFNLELLNELLFAKAVGEAKPEDVGDGYGSDSEDECELVDRPLYSKKLITHNGMRALWCTLIAAVKHLDSPTTVYLNDAYYEVNLGRKLIADLHKINFTVVKKQSEAAIIIHDLNACITNATINSDYKLKDTNKILILDCTSATSSQVHTHLLRYATSRANVMFLTDSGFKNQQLGCDKNQYGTVRIISSDKKKRDTLYKQIKKIEPALLSPTSHFFRRKMKQIGAAPTTDSYLRPKA